MRTRNFYFLIIPNRPPICIILVCRCLFSCIDVFKGSFLGEYTIFGVLYLLSIVIHADVSFYEFQFCAPFFCHPIATVCRLESGGVKGKQAYSVFVPSSENRTAAVLPLPFYSIVPPSFVILFWNTGYVGAFVLPTIVFAIP